MCVSELEARVRLALNRQLSSINTWLQRRRDQLELIDSATDGRCDQIRAHLHAAHQQLQVNSLPSPRSFISQ